MAVAEPQENIANLANSLETPNYANLANIALSKGSHVVKFCISEKGQTYTDGGWGRMNTCRQ